MPALTPTPKQRGKGYRTLAARRRLTMMRRDVAATLHRSPRALVVDRCSTYV